MTKAKTVRDIMTRRVIVLSEEENLDRLEAGMERFSLRHLPVVDNGKLVGLVSHRDVLRFSASPLLREPAGRTEAVTQNTFVSEIMTRNVRTVSPETPLVEAARTLLEARFGCLPVINEEGTLVGIVTEYDFLRLAVQLLDENQTPDEEKPKADQKASRPVKENAALE